MAFDLTTAKPVSKGKFDMATAKPVQDTGPGLAFKRPSIPFTAPKAFTGAPNPMSVVQNLGAAAQREESALAGAGEEVLSGRFQNVPKEFMRGIRGEQTTQFGDLMTRRGVNPDVAATVGFGASMLTPTNLIATALTGGTNKLLTPVAAKPVTAVGSGIGRLLRTIADVPQSVVEKGRELTGKYGKKFVHSQAKVEPGFIGKEMAPKVGETISERVMNLDPIALREHKLTDDAVAEVTKASKEHGIKRLPTTKEADDLYRTTIESAPDVRFNVTGLRNEVGTILRENGVLDESGRVVSGVVKDNRVLSGLLDTWKNLNKRISSNRSIGKLLGTEDVVTKGTLTKEGTVRGSGVVGEIGSGKVSSEAQRLINEILKNPDELDKGQFLRTRANLAQLITGDDAVDRHIYRVIGALDQIAEDAGVKGIGKAKASFKISRLGEKAINAIKDPSFLEKTEGSLRQAVDPEKFQLREALKRLVGPGGEKLIDELESIFVKRQLQSKGFWPSRSGIIEKGAKSVVGKFEKERARLVDVLKNFKKPLNISKKPVALAERSTLRKMAQGMSEKEDE